MHATPGRAPNGSGTVPHFAEPHDAARVPVVFGEQLEGLLCTMNGTEGTWFGLGLNRSHRWAAIRGT